MTQVTLTGQLICANEAEVARVSAALDAHITATRAEPGCLSFDVVMTANPLVWQVDEQFVDAAAFQAHQNRASTSAWAHETIGIERAYTITGLE